MKDVGRLENFKPWYNVVLPRTVPEVDSLFTAFDVGGFVEGVVGVIGVVGLIGGLIGLIGVVGLIGLIGLIGGFIGLVGLTGKPLPFTLIVPPEVIH